MKDMVLKLYIVEEKTGYLSSSELHPLYLIPSNGESVGYLTTQLLTVFGVDDFLDFSDGFWNPLHNAIKGGTC